MSEENRDSIQWGRPVKRKSRGPKPQAPGAAPAVGPIEDPSSAGELGAIIRAPRSTVAPTHEVIGAPKPARVSSEPDTDDYELRDLVAHIARGLVDRPDEVEVEIVEAGSDATFELEVHPDDLGHVIGKQGRTARSIRLALGAAAAKRGRRAGLDIAD
jgi:predicted RNA-binding protein YlqC (UPF0109 family)